MVDQEKRNPDKNGIDGIRNPHVLDDVPPEQKNMAMTDPIGEVVEEVMDNITEAFVENDRRSSEKRESHS